MEVSHGVQAGWMKRDKIRKKTNGNVFKSVETPVTIYGSETWPVKKALQMQLNVTVIRILRWMMGKQWGVKCETIQYARWSLWWRLRESLKRYDYVTMDLCRRDKRGMFHGGRWTCRQVEGRRLRRRPKRRWRDSIGKDVREKGLNTGDSNGWKRKILVRDPYKVKSWSKRRNIKK